jgi:hypothetical protein
MYFIEHGGVVFATFFAIQPAPITLEIQSSNLHAQTIQSLKTRALLDVLESLEKKFLISPTKVESP